MLDVPADSTLGELHDLLQTGVGWLGLEAHQFVSGATSYLPSAEGHRLGDLDGHFGYVYDPRARWEHDVVVLGPGRDTAGCVYGEGACPPETSGGPKGYAEQLRTLPEGMRELFWAPHGPEFDQARTDLRVRQMAGVVPETVRLLLGLTRGGVETTPDGAFPAAVVEAVHRRRPRWATPAEGSLPPLLALHSVLRTSGLLLEEKGRVRPALATRNGLFVVRKLRSWFSPGTFAAAVAGFGVGALTARGRLPEDALVDIVLGEVHREHPVNGDDVRRTLLHLLPALTGLDLAERTATGWHPGPSARSLLPQATALAVYAPADVVQNTEVGPAGLEPTTPAV